MLVTSLGISGYLTEKEEVKEDNRAMQGAKSLGKQIAQLVNAIKRQ